MSLISTSASSRSTKTQKKKEHLGQYPAILTGQAWITTKNFTFAGTK